MSGICDNCKEPIYEAFGRLFHDSTQDERCVIWLTTTATYQEPIQQNNSKVGTE